ncbi:MAG TPA: hypothetical protein VFF70_02355 [Anaerolineae bacterium]|nr:hypothetical protein [Anaerolineae bacterium]
MVDTASQSITKSNPSMRRRIFSVIALVSITLLSVSVVLEIGLRIFWRLIPLGVCASSPIIGNYYCQPYIVYDKPMQLAYHYAPGFKTEGYWDPADPHSANPGNETAPTGRTDKFLYKMQMDSMGFPNDDVTWKDQYDIVIAGDSFVLRSAPQTWIELLRGDTGMTTLALGAPSWAPINEVNAIETYGLDKHPKWVVLMYFEGNDLYGTGQFLERQSTGLSWAEWDFQHSALGDQLIVPHLISYAVQQIFPSSATPHYRYPITASTEAGNIQMVLKDFQLLALSADYNTLAHSDEFLAEKAKILEIRDLVEGQGGRFLLVYIPSKEHVYWSRIWDSKDVNNILERTETVTLSDGDHGHLVYSPQYLSFDVFNQNQTAQETLFDDMTKQNNVEFLNLMPVFWNATIQHGEFYNYADPHWNQAGNQLAADTIAEYIRTH